MIKSKNILFVVHRYYPFPGGSEYYVQHMAEEMVSRGHEVCVLTGQHQCPEGKLNGVYVATDIVATLMKPWDLIVVHGGDVGLQNVVHTNAYNIKSPIAYMIIKPSDSEVCVHGMKYATFLTYSTSMDIDHIRKHGFIDKARRVRHGIPKSATIVYNHEEMTKLESIYEWTDFGGRRPEAVTFLSVGGFWPNKAMKELVGDWKSFGFPPDQFRLVITGYGMYENAPKHEPENNIYVLKDIPKDHIPYLMIRSDGYIMNSTEEGFGLVLLESMCRHLPWAARNIAAAKDLYDIDNKFGTIYNNKDELKTWIERIENQFVSDYNSDDAAEMSRDLGDAERYVLTNHSIKQTGNDIENMLIELEKSRW